MHVYIYRYICKCIHITYVYRYVYICVYMCLCVYVYMCICVYVYVCICIFSNIRMYLCMYIYICIYIYMYIYIWILNSFLQGMIDGKARDLTINYGGFPMPLKPLKPPKPSNHSESHLHRKIHSAFSKNGAVDLPRMMIHHPNFGLGQTNLLLGDTREVPSRAVRFRQTITEVEVPFVLTF